MLTSVKQVDAIHNELRVCFSWLRPLLETYNLTLHTSTTMNPKTLISNLRVSKPSTSGRRASCQFGCWWGYCHTSLSYLSSLFKSSQTNTTGDSKDHHLSNIQTLRTLRIEEMSNSSRVKSTRTCWRLDWLEILTLPLRVRRRSTPRSQESTSPWTKFDQYDENILMALLDNIILLNLRI